MTVLFYGDPHGEWRLLLRACAERPPAAVVILGDCDLDMPLDRKLAPLLSAGTRVRWIPGNHDNDTVAFHDHLWGSCPAGNLHASYARLGPFMVGGLGGIFKEGTWYPRFDLAEPIHPTRRSYMRQVRPGDRWRGGLPLGARDTIFPEDVDRLAGLRLDVLVTHDAPTSHRHGFVGIDEAARLCRARLVVHGHHHEAYLGRTQAGLLVRGLARAEVFRLPDDLPEWAGQGS